MRIVFVTGTDTGVGKTFVTACCLADLLRSGRNVRAVKPFCSGERTDALLLWELQDRKLPLDSINPFYFEQPVSPWTAARLHGSSVSFGETVKLLREQQSGCDLLLVEGAGGLLSPLGQQFNAADLIVELRAEVILVAANRLGVLNHTLLSLEALQRRNATNVKIALVNGGTNDASIASNQADLRELAKPISVYSIGFAANYRPEASFVRQHHDPNLRGLLL